MPKYFDTLLGAAAPATEIGATFTANVGPNVIPPRGVFLDHIVLSVMGDLGAAVPIETFIGTINQFTVKAGQETRIQLAGQDLVALMAAFYKQLPRVAADSPSAGGTYIVGIKVPIQETIQQGVTYTWAATYTAVSNITVQKLEVKAVYLSSAPAGKSPVIVVPITYTTPGATGMSAVNARLQNLGQLMGLMLFQTTVLGNASDVFDIQNLQLVESGKQTSLLSAVQGQNILGQGQFGIADPLAELLSQYCFFDFSDDPLDVKAGYLEMIADVEVTAEAVRIIPIVLKS